MAMTPQLRPAQPQFRKILACSLLSACGVLAAACGSTAAPGTAAPGASASGGGHSAGTTAAAKASLSVVTTAPQAIRHWTLRCDPPGGTAPDAAAACNQLIADKDIFRRSDVRVMCPMIMADAASYIINGTWFGRPVHLTVVDGGCDVTRWSQLHQIFN
jgi:subtilisin inhibitor-like